LEFLEEKKLESKIFKLKIEKKMKIKYYRSIKKQKIEKWYTGRGKNSIFLNKK